MEVAGGAEEGFVREWTPCSHILNLIPPRIQNGLFSNELCLTCVDAVSEYIALGTNVGLVYWYDRKKGNIQRLRCEASTSPITYVKIVSTVDYMVGAGNAAGQVTVFQIPKEHPENIPDNFKPKVEPKVERYTIGDLHKSKITAIEWSKNGMRLFSGDKNGVIIMTEIDFYMHLCKSQEIVNEGHEIVQMSYCQSALLVSSVYRSIVCARADARWRVSQLGKKERKSLCALGGVWQHSYARGGAAGAAAAFCARAGLRVWRADAAGTVHQTLLFKEAISNPLTVAELLNPAARKHSHADREYNFGPLHVFREHFLVSHNEHILYILDPRSLTAVAVVDDLRKEHFLVSHNEHILYILDPRSLTAVAVVDDLRKILSVSVTKDEIFVLEGPRSLVRLAHAPEPAALRSEEPINLMTKSLTSSIQLAVSTVRELTALDVPLIAGVLEPFARDNETAVASAEECFELPPIKHLPGDISENVLESIINEFKETAVSSAEEYFELSPVKHLPGDISENVLESIINEFKDVSSDAEEIRRAKSEELQRKLKLYNSIMEKKCDEELIHSSRRSRRRDGGSGSSTPRMATPVRRADAVSYTSPCLMNVSVYGEVPQNDDLLEKQIEEKEKMLAKLLNLESLSISTPKTDHEKPEPPPQPTYKKFQLIDTPYIDPPKEKPAPKQIQDSRPIDLVPKVVQLPNNWNLGDIELKLEKTNGLKGPQAAMSPEEPIESDWEII